MTKTLVRRIDKRETKLSPTQILFCELYITDQEFFGNGTAAYIEAYQIDLTHKGAYNGARASASRLLTNANVLRRINDLLESAVLNDEYVDKQLAFLITQSSELGTKLSAIKEYNNLKSRIIHKSEHTSTVDVTHTIDDKIGQDYLKYRQSRIIEQG